MPLASTKAPTHDRPRAIRRAPRRRAPFGRVLLCCAAFMIAVGVLLLWRQNCPQHEIAAYVNLSGRQRMLSQRIALAAERLNPSDASSRDRLSQLLDEFESVHLALRDGSAARGLTATNSPAVNRLFFEAPSELDRHVAQYVDAVRDVLRAAEPGRASIDKVVRTALDKELLLGLDQLVATLQSESEQRVAVADELLLGLMALLGLSLVVAAASATPWSPAAAASRRRTRELQSLVTTVVQEAKDFAIFTLTPSGEVRSWNAGAERIKGYEEHEVLGEHFSCFYTAEDVQQGKPERLLTESVQDDGVEDEGWQLRKDGSRYWANTVITPLYDDNNRLLGFSKITRDLTERRRLNKRFEKSIESAPVAMLLIDGDRKIVLANAETEKLFGYSRRELIGKQFETLVPKPLRFSDPDFIADLFENPKRCAMGSGWRVRGVTKTGGEAPVEIGLSTISVDDETLVLAAIVDMREIEASRSKAEESERRFIDLADSAPLAMWVTDEYSHCVWLNKRWVDYVGRPLEEGFGAGWLEALHPDDRDSSHAAYTAALERRQPFSVRYRLQRHDGEYRWHTAFGQPRLDAEGEFRGYVGLSVDDHEATVARQELERAHKALMESAAIHRSLIDQSNNFVGLMTLDGKVIDVNRTALKAAGVAAETVLNKPFVDTPWWAHSDSLRDRLRRSIKTASAGRADAFEATHVGSDGQIIHVDFSLTPVNDESGRTIYLIPEGRDVTLHRQREKELQELLNQLDSSNRELEQFAYIASHDLQEPLRKISAYCQLLREEQGDRLEKEGLDYLRVAIDGAERLKALVRDLLAFSRIATRGNELGPVDAEECLDEALDNLEVTRRESLAEIVRAPLPAVIADRSQLVRLLQNLVSNAIKYRGDEAPRIEIGWERLDADADHLYRFFVRDNGIGIADEHQEQVFGIFQRLHNRREYSGTGIGLAICKRIVERFGGSIWIESEEGCGSTFYFTVRGLEGEEHNAPSGTHEDRPALVGAGV